jgi:membrane-associated protease RseP (regulator of RpoE activity)
LSRDGQPGAPFPSPLIELLPSAGPDGGGSVYAAAPRPPERRLYGRAGVLFALTFLCTTTLSPVMVLMSRTDVTTLLDPFLTPTVVAAVWRSPELLRIGLAFSIPALLILLCHEMGHYIACRIYRIPCTPPFFLPVPVNFGTFGAFIRIKAPIHDKRQLFDVGVAGPLAGFVALIPFLLYGIAHSRPVPMSAGGHGMTLLLPGRSLAIELATRLFHGPLAPGEILNLHPTALAAWLGLFATALNLLPLGQLDGGHILYAATGALQRRLALPFWLALALLGYLWPGWLLWCVIVLVIGLRHPPVYDEDTPLDPKRRALAWVALLLFALSFMPVPIQYVTVP